MKDFRKIFKELAQSKTLCAAHIIQRCILMAMRRGVKLGFEFKTNEALYAKQADYYIRKAFTPITRKVKLDNGREPYDTVYWTLPAVKFDMNMMRFFDNEEEVAQFKTIIDELIKLYAKPSDYYKRHYFYVFVRQDISPEYQAVQACHAAAKMGHREGKALLNEKAFDQLYITLIGVPDIAALEVAITDAKEVGAEIYEFREPDIGNELTAVATSPIRMEDRKRLLSYKRLKFPN